MIPEKKKKSSVHRLSFGSEREYFLENFATLLTSGMNVTPALEALKVDAHSSAMSKMIGQVIEDIEEGESLWKSFDRVGLLPPSVLSLLRIGEESGRLKENVQVILCNIQKERVFRSKMRSAMMYPIFIFVMMILICVGITWFILPRLATVFSQLDLELPVLTRILIAVGFFLRQYGFVAVPLAMVIIVACVFVFFVFPRTKHLGQAFLMRIPGIKKMIQESELARSSFIFSTLLKAGIPILTALDAVARSTPLRPYERVYRHLKENIEMGRSFQEAFAAFPHVQRYIPYPVQQMIIAGGQSGHLSEALAKISEIYENKNEMTTKNVSVIFEPILLVIIWLGVVFIALAIIMPIYSLIGDFNT